MSTVDASIYDNSLVGSYSIGSDPTLYMRTASMPLNSTLDTAVNLGTLIADKTQLDAQGEISRQNSTHFYKFTLDGSWLKLTASNITSSASMRVQVLNSSGTVIADSSSAHALRDKPLGGSNCWL